MIMLIKLFLIIFLERKKIWEIFEVKNIFPDKL
jgi:hypothetical protein